METNSLVATLQPCRAPATQRLDPDSNDCRGPRTSSGEVEHERPLVSGVNESEPGCAAERDDHRVHDALVDFARSLAPVTASGGVSAIRELLHPFGSGVEDDTAVLAIHALPPSQGTTR